MAKRVLVTGATGYIGGRLVPRLLDAGFTVRVLVRDRERATAMPWASSVEIAIGDVTDPESMSAALADVDVLFYLVHAMTAGRGFEDRDRRGADVTASAARAANVAQIVYLGGLHPDGVRLSEHLRSRVEVGEILMRSGVPTLVFQAGVVIGSGSASFEMVRHLTEVLPYMPAPKWVRNHIQPIAIRDVLYYLVSSAGLDHPVNRAFDIGGPDILRYGQMMNGYAVEAGLRQRAIAALPVLTPRLASHWVNLVTPIPRSIARPLVESLQHDCVMKNHDIDALIPPPAEGLLPYRTAVKYALGRMESGDIETSWQDATVAGADANPLPSDPEWAGHTVFVDRRERRTDAPAQQVWRVITGIGGQRGWYSWPLAWAMRGWLDKLVGGVGLRRGRRDPDELAVGDALDFWRVEALDPGRMLRLRAEMKVPGRAWLEMTVTPDGNGARYVQRAIFFPRGLGGRLYWWSIVPVHGVIFNGMADRIVAAAAADAASETIAHAP